MTQQAIEFGADELFFSTTDSRGVIEKANGVFVRLSQYDWEQLVGAPHNVIRHDDMPGAAFRLMWQTLQAGEPFCAYVVNRAASGAPYTVFATITPLGDGYLSVRSRPCAEELLQAALGLYRPTRELERECLARGMGAPAAAVQGLERLGELLGQAGLEDYTDFVEQALPAEVVARAALAGPLPSREGEGELYDLLASVRRIESQLEGWLSQMSALAELTTALHDGAEQLRGATQASSRTAAEVAEVAGAAPIMLAVNLWASMVPEVQQSIDELLASLDELARSCRRTRFRIALARLHADATGQFVVELVDERSGARPAQQGSGVAAIGDLARALEEGMQHTAAQGRRNAELAGQVAGQIEAVRELMLVPQGLLGNWQEMAGEREDEQVAALVPRMAQQVDQGEQESRTLAALAERCRAQAAPLDVRGVATELERVRVLAGAVTGVEDEATPVVRPRRGA